MDPMLLGAVALGIAVLGMAVHAWRFRATRTIPLSTLWLMVPLLGAVIAFLQLPPSLLTVGLGGASFALAVVTLVAPILVPAVVTVWRPEGEAVVPRKKAA